MLALGDPEAVLAVRFGALGDGLLARPALFALRRRFPAAALQVLAPGGAAPFLCPPADRATASDGEAGAALFHGRAALWPGMPPGRAVVWRTEPDLALTTGLAALGVREVLWAPSLPPADHSIHVADLLQRGLAPWGVAPVDPDELPPPMLAGHARRWARAWLQEQVDGKAPLAVLLPGSGSPRKNWPGFGELASGLRAAGFAVVLVGGLADEEALAVARRGAGEGVAVVAGQPLERVAGLLAEAAVVVANDSGPAHLAAALGVPTLALFGPSDPRRWRPRGPRAQVVALGEPCADCHANAIPICRHGDRWRERSAEPVLAQVLAIGGVPG
jgi:heptosyltransferase-3